MTALATVAPLLSRPSILGHEFRRGIESFAHHACSALGLPSVKVKWGPIGTAAINASGTMILADCADDEKIGRARVARLVAYVVHELLHRKFTAFHVRDQRPYVAALHNAVEDAWIERRAIREGLLGNIEPLLRALVSDMVDESLLEVTDWTDPRQYPWAFAVLARGYGKTVPVPGALLPAFKDAASRIDACTCSADTLEIARWLYDFIQDPQPTQEPDQDGDQDQEDQDPGQEGEPSEGQETAQDGAEGEGEEGGQGAGSEASQDPADAGEAQRPNRNTQAREVEPSSGQSTSGDSGSFTREAVPAAALGKTAADRWPVGAPAPGRLRYEVRKLFEKTAREWRDGGFRAGTLHRAALHKVALDQPEIFARRHSEEGIDSAVVIMLDISGSMFPAAGDADRDAKSRIGCAVGACAMLLDCLAQAQAASMVIGFGQSTYVLKTWGQPWRQILPTLRQVGCEGDTNDFHALRMAHDYLLQHPAQRRVVLAITDGQGDGWRTAAQREAGERLGIQHYGIGIQMDCSSTWGPRSVMIRTPQDLGSVALQQVRRAAA